METQINKLKKIMADKFGVPQDLITSQSNLTSDLNLGNLEISDLISIIIHEFDLNIKGEDQIEQIKTVEDLLNLIDNFSEEL
ncbi:hypothetical protein A3D78_01530 [Candidatus Gottesmanbacteria bacterium RIFCSPHIGHO2_02_FULL_39_14]|uniref:Carrier domain-containing protein n=1 Tax=Candidatus Gottesmanbacteria bacterium RIFCSPHIGHO2_02_FULL_39_14 TaxID=1798383 RepID=A0A1F5ZWA7_9BACT|nr:MAG: hypothetical protein A3D78_01530 [Candidatus Gottesmanbacteria bacterium RIFCSPHIGHO2_02_FULL_39_14]